MKVYNRKTKKYEEIETFGQNALKKVYSSKLLLKIATSRPISKLYGLYNKSIISKSQIKKFIKSNNIDMSKYEETTYKTFNEFFIRKLKKYNIDKNKKSLISPCDSKLTVYKIKEDLNLNIKDQNYNLNELFDNENLDEFKNGYVLVFRLSVDNYHRFHYIDDGKTLKRKIIKGKFHTVSDASKKYKIYKENQREYSILDTENFGKMIYMEVGAMLIGKIINHNLPNFKKGEEKGYFLPGASTVVLVLNNIKIDDDILENSKNNIETLVEIGEKIGVVK